MRKQDPCLTPFLTPCWGPAQTQPELGPGVAQIKSQFEALRSLRLDAFVLRPSDCGQVIRVPLGPVPELLFLAQESLRH